MDKNTTCHNCNYHFQPDNGIYIIDETFPHDIIGKGNNNTGELYLCPECFKSLYNNNEKFRDWYDNNTKALDIEDDNNFDYLENINNCSHFTTFQVDEDE